ncbi:MAG: energy-coupling factor ABC transporter ATP-binding protein [Clostridiales bacterium]|jgi:cobalt/nickel transport system ATP-binding protein|nr:energy-coupling factor ABC transporter ATP-binding protein [Clostridiales bacterium]
MLELTDISYYYGEHEALANVSMNIQRGESVSLLGANGCGKSTLLRILNGLIFPSSGKYMFGGEPITKKSLSKQAFSNRFHSRIGFLFQNVETQLFCTDVYDEIAFGPRQAGMSERDVDIRVKEIISLMKLGGFEHRTPYHLSGGEKKKIALASILALSPEVLALDEPMNGLDPKSARWLCEFLAKQNALGTTLILSTHNLDLVNEITKRSILFSEEHKVAADLPTLEMLENIELLKKVNMVDEHYSSYALNYLPRRHID